MINKAAGYMRKCRDLASSLAGRDVSFVMRKNNVNIQIAQDGWTSPAALALSALQLLVTAAEPAHLLRASFHTRIWAVVWQVWCDHAPTAMRPLTVDAASKSADASIGCVQLALLTQRLRCTL